MLPNGNRLQSPMASLPNPLLMMTNQFYRIFVILFNNGIKVPQYLDTGFSKASNIIRFHLYIPYLLCVMLRCVALTSIVRNK